MNVAADSHFHQCGAIASWHWPHILAFRREVVGQWVVASRPFGQVCDWGIPVLRKFRASLGEFSRGELKKKKKKISPGRARFRANLCRRTKSSPSQQSVHRLMLGLDTLRTVGAPSVPEEESEPNSTRGRNGGTAKIHQLPHEGSRRVCLLYLRS